MKHLKDFENINENSTQQLLDVLNDILQYNNTLGSDVKSFESLNYEVLSGVIRLTPEEDKIYQSLENQYKSMSSFRKDVKLLASKINKRI